MVADSSQVCSTPGGGLKSSCRPYNNFGWGQKLVRSTNQVRRDLVIRRLSIPFVATLCLQSRKSDVSDGTVIFVHPTTEPLFFPILFWPASWCSCNWSLFLARFRRGSTEIIQHLTESQFDLSLNHHLCGALAINHYPFINKYKSIQPADPSWFSRYTQHSSSRPIEIG